MVLTAAFAPLVDLVYPPRCPLCGGAIAAQDGLCLSCWHTLEIPGSPACQLCQIPLGSQNLQGNAVCKACRATPPDHDGIVAGVLYNDTARDLVLAFKRGRRIGLAPMLARLIAGRLGSLDGDWLAVPVPLHRWRLWQRGFNQSALLARELAKVTGARLAVDALERVRPTPSLGGLGRSERSEALRGAIAPNPARRRRLAGAQVLLVDDVLTSGATAQACLAALKKGGTREVRIACFARRVEEGWS